jgi:pimeloyl-ACP methyl ester carboxylesterase
MAEEVDIRPYKIAIEETRLNRLKQKLELTDLPIELQSDTIAEWSRGPPAVAINKLTRYWIDEYDWRKEEALLNETLPQFITTISVEGQGDYDVHFLHKRSKAKNAIPLVFLHGWPGSFYEAAKIIHPLADGDGEDEPRFHVVAPSLIDHGFSSGSKTVSWRRIDTFAEDIPLIELCRRTSISINMPSS